MTTLTPENKHHRYKLKFHMHAGQREVDKSTARFRVVACGRQWGKTRYACAWALKRAVAGKRGWWVAPDANIADIGWETVSELASQIPGTTIQQSHPRTIKFPSGGWLQVKGAHNPGKLRGRTLDFLVVDEAAYIQTGERWNSELRPTLAVRGGEALFISTFNGFNWFYDLYERGQDPNEPEWESWRMPSSDNPFLPREEIEDARRQTPADQFAQEWLASPLSRVGGVFPGDKVQAAIDRGKDARVDHALPKYAGLDWGYRDATVFVVCQEDTESKVTWIDERNWVVTQLDTRVAQIIELTQRYGIEAIYADAAGASENAKLIHELQAAGLDTTLVRVPFGKRVKHGETLKDSGIKARRWYLENDLEKLGPRVPELIRTTRSYHYKENSEDVEKGDDHPVDAATCFYASRRSRVVEER